MSGLSIEEKPERDRVAAKVTGIQATILFRDLSPKRNAKVQVMAQNTGPIRWAPILSMILEAAAPNSSDMLSQM